MERLKGKTILLGREPGQGRLLVAVKGEKAAIIGSQRLPDSVSRCKVADGTAHAQIEIDHNGNMIMTNLKPENVTYINGIEIASKRINPQSSVQLGKDHYKINLPVVFETAKKLIGPEPPKKYIINHLKDIWEEYEANGERITKKQQSMQKLRMIPMMLGAVSTVCAFVFPEQKIITLSIAGLSFFILLISFLVKDKSPQKRKELSEWFTDNYLCPNPNCNKFLGNQNYKLVKRQYGMHCPYCKSEFVEDPIIG